MTDNLRKPLNLCMTDNEKAELRLGVERSGKSSLSEYVRFIHDEFWKWIGVNDE